MQKHLAVAVLLATSAAAAQYAKYIDPMLGTAGGGNTFPGPVVPFGMMKPGPDMGLNVEGHQQKGERRNNGNAGWEETGDINGFSQLHVSGTGGGVKYGNILVQPTVGKVETQNYSSPRANEQAKAGYYKVSLTRYPVDVEITAARRTGVYRFTYPASGERNLLFDMSHLLSAYEYQGEGQYLIKSSIHIDSPTELSGFQTLNGGWNEQKRPFTVYFFATTDTPAKTSGTWKGSQIAPANKSSEGGPDDLNGAFLTFALTSKREVRMKIGISFMSEAQAKANAASEVSGFDFDGTRAKNVALWDKALAPIELTGVSEADRGVFYTALYHTMLMPVDRTGENPLWSSTEPAYDDFYAIWDTFRSSSPLLTIIAPDREQAIVRSLIDIAKHDDWLPDARSGNASGRVQGGSNGDFVLADAYIKKIPGIDWAAAYAALIKDAEVNPPDQIMVGRGDLDDWKKLGYLTIEGVDRPVSKGMEYAADDYAIALVAKGLGKQDDYQKYLKRSNNWKNFWKPDAQDAGFSGFVWSRHRDGTWKQPFDSMMTGTWGSDIFYEGNSWTYSTYVPQDVAGLIAMSGGNDTFVKRMDAFFAGKGRYDVGNEPGFLSPYLYNWAGRQDRTAEQIRRILQVSYHAGPKGLPGNDDSGAMSSWYAFGKMGFYPNAGQDVYVIGSPAYPSTTIHLANGKTFTIEAKGVSAANKYIVHAEWNGKPWKQSWFTHEDLLGGGYLVFTMTDKPAQWFTGPPPPSSSTNK